MKGDTIDTSFEYSVLEEIWHSISHGIGLLLSVSALTLLTVFAVQSGDDAKIASALVFGIALIVMYGASTLYHAIRIPHTKFILQQIDHCAIYLLIAGTYTPISLLGVQGVWGWTLFGIAWGIAAIGMSLIIFYPKRFHLLSLCLYALMGWMVIIAAKPLIHNTETLPLVFLLTGGIIYTLGIIFYVRKKLYLSHVIWHFFVLGGSIFHFFAILLLIKH